jgi:hypothetical protein
MNKKVLNKEILRINEIIGIKPKKIISEQITGLLSKLGNYLDDIFSSEKVVKTINRTTGAVDRILIDGVEVTESFLTSLKGLIKSDPDNWFDALDEEGKKILGRILAKDADALSSSWEDFLREANFKDEKEYFKNIYAAAEKQKKPVDKVIEESFTDSNGETDWLLVNFFKSKIKSGVNNLSDLEKRAAISTAKIGLKNTAKDIEFGWFKFLRNYWVGGVAKKLLVPTKLGRKIYPPGTTYEKALDDIIRDLHKCIMETAFNE